VPRRPAASARAETSVAPQWSQVASITLTDKVYAALRTEVEARRLRSGEYLREGDIAKALGVSRTPLREACARLASEGFLERMPNRGYRVPVESPQELLKLYPIVAALEVLAAESAFEQLTASEFKILRRINGELDVASKRDDWGAAIQLNNQFHHELSALCANDRLCKLLDDLRAQMTRLELWSAGHRGHRETAVREHAVILDAAEAGDFERALALLRQHRLYTYQSYLAEVGSAGGKVPEAPPEPAKSRLRVRTR
jgi:DNA-binding GntR family transcriptional regulator